MRDVVQEHNDLMDELLMERTGLDVSFEQLAEVWMNAGGKSLSEVIADLQAEQEGSDE